MPGYHAIRIATGKLNHALLILDVGSVIGVGECGAGFVFGEVAIEIAIVGGEDERRIAFDEQILRSVGVVAAGVSANAGKDFHIVAIDEADAAFGIELDE